LKKVLITTLGCKVNQFESAAFAASFTAAGMEIVSPKDHADTIVINTCAVTASAGAQSRQAIRRSLRKNPGARIIITGCYAELAAEDLTALGELEGRDYLLIGNSSKESLVAAALGGVDNPLQLMPGKILAAREISRLPLAKFGQRSRAYLRIQDGCESFCSYCIVPYTRGPSRSLPMAEVLQQAKIFADEGYGEIVLTGIHLGYYGDDLNPRENIVSLLDKLTLVTPQTSYRISSLEPLEISNELLMLMAQRQNIQPHLHIPLQSGHDKILQSMNRRYTTSQFKEVISRCHQAVADLAIGIDILAGFPGETEEYFESSQNFLQELSFSYLHVFPYSIRPGTPAAKMDGQLSKATKDQRVTQLRQLSERKRITFYSSQLGKIRPVLVEGKKDNSVMFKGFTDNYVAVRFSGKDILPGSVLTVRLESICEDYVLGIPTEITTGNQ
jgi:threonylcarbamoyladenosine tRNA methylthiotransferase MtaB